MVSFRHKLKAVKNIIGFYHIFIFQHKSSPCNLGTLDLDFSLISVTFNLIFLLFIIGLLLQLLYALVFILSLIFLNFKALWGDITCIMSGQKAIYFNKSKIFNSFTFYEADIILRFMPLLCLANRSPLYVSRCLYWAKECKILHTQALLLYTLWLSLVVWSQYAPVLFCNTRLIHFNITII